MTLAALVLAADLGAGAAAPVAVVAGEPITRGTLDARCGEPCVRVGTEVHERKAAMLETMIGEALLASGPRLATPPVAEAEVDAYLAAHAADFQGPPERDRAAVRFFLEREARRRAEDELMAAERVRRPPRLRLPRGVGALADEGAPDRLLAEAGGRTIRDRDVERRLALPLYRLRGALARERRRQLDAVVAERLWAHEARARGLSAAALRAEVRARAAPVTDADVDRYFESEVRSRSPAAERRPERLRPLLEFRAAEAAAAAFLAELRERYAVRVTLAEPRPPRLALGPGHGGWRGLPDAPATVIFLTGYRDRASRAMWPVVDALAQEPGTALAVRALIPLWDPEATTVAAAVRCAATEGRQWAVHDRVARAPSLPDRAALERIAEAAGLALEPFTSCLARPETFAAVAAESAEAERLGLDAPPAVLVDGLAFGGMQEPEGLRAAAEAARRN